MQDGENVEENKIFMTEPQLFVVAQENAAQICVQPFRVRVLFNYRYEIYNLKNIFSNVTLKVKILILLKFKQILKTGHFGQT